MPARRCIECDLNVPLSIEGMCPICDGRFLYFAGKKPDDNWEERYFGASELNELEAAKETGAALMDKPTPWSVHPVIDQATLIYRDDMDSVWVHNDELVRLGYRSYEPFDVVKLNGKYYELTYLDRKTRFWEVLELNFYEWATEAIDSLPDHEGPSSDDIVWMIGPEGRTLYLNPNLMEDDAA